MQGQEWAKARVSAAHPCPPDVEQSEYETHLSAFLERTELSKAAESMLALPRSSIAALKRATQAHEEWAFSFYGRGLPGASPVRDAARTVVAVKSDSIAFRKDDGRTTHLTTAGATVYGDGSTFYVTHEDNLAILKYSRR